MSKPAVTVLIATFNRAERLRRTLEGLRNMSVPAEIEWELIVVDNNSTDDTRGVVAEFFSTSGLRVRYLFDPSPGKSHALNLGANAAEGGIISVLDDDVIPATDWLANIWREFSSDSELGALCGRIELADPRDLPIMLVTQSSRKEIGAYPDLIGRFAGCVSLRREVLDDVGVFDTLLGPGAPFRGLMDMDYNYRIWKAGWKMLYAPSMLAFHNHGRRTAKAKRALFRAYSIGTGAFNAKLAMSGDVLGAKRMYWFLDARAREVLRGENVAPNCRHAVWLIAGFVGYAAFRCWRAVWK